MKVTGTLTKVDRLPYQARLLLRSCSHKDISSVSVTGSTEELKLPELGRKITIDVRLWLVSKISKSDTHLAHFIIQNSRGVNGTEVFAQVTDVLPEGDGFICKIVGIEGELVVETERDLQPEIGVDVYFSGELTTGIEQVAPSKTDSRLSDS